MGKYSSPWKSPDAQHASVHIAKVIEPEISHLVFTGGISYQSMNMSKGINASGIVPWKRLLIALLLLDPRGGHFSQAHVIMGLTIATSSPTLKAAIEKDAADKSYVSKRYKSPYDQWIDVQVFKIRVLLAHVKIKARQWFKKKLGTHCTGLIEMFELINEDELTDATPQKQNPFVLFRTMDTDDADSDIDDSEGDEPEALCVLVARETSTAFAEKNDDVKVVQTEFDYKDMVAYQFMSDGSKRLAISYGNGADQFLVAIFASGPWPTEAPSVWMDGDGRGGTHLHGNFVG